MPREGDMIVRLIYSRTEAFNCEANSLMEVLSSNHGFNYACAAGLSSSAAPCRANF